MLNGMRGAAPVPHWQHYWKYRETLDAEIPAYPRQSLPAAEFRLMVAHTRLGAPFVSHH